MLKLRSVTSTDFNKHYHGVSDRKSAFRDQTPRKFCWVSGHAKNSALGRDLGRGRMGDVYLGWDEQLEQNVAIKAPRREDFGSEQDWCPRGYLMPVRLLSRLFRGKFLALLKAAHRRGELTFAGRLLPLNSYPAFSSWLSPLYARDWVVYAKPPWNGPEHVLKYLARYTHRVAIANQRIQSIDGGQVTFTYNDYRHQHRQRTLTLAATEFIRRFMMHVLPNGFVRIRYYGFLANTHRKQQLRRIRELLDIPQPASQSDETDNQQQDPALPAYDERCPHCQEGLMWPIEMAPRLRLSEILNLPLLVPT